MQVKAGLYVRKSPKTRFLESFSFNLFFCGLLLILVSSNKESSMYPEIREKEEAPPAGCGVSGG